MIISFFSVGDDNVETVGGTTLEDGDEDFLVAGCRCSTFQPKG